MPCSKKLIGLYVKRKPIEAQDSSIHWGISKHPTFGHFKHAHCTSDHAEYRYTEKTIHTKNNLPGYSFINISQSSTFFYWFTLIQIHDQENYRYAFESVILF